ncbi:hypothetical protein B0H21DRAFT_1386 [Amylocystis lapponica]|nr:hypothetical protein B0H21DRAFT_1386 [Amylocystis lapponica]
MELLIPVKETRTLAGHPFTTTTVAPASRSCTAIGIRSAPCVLLRRRRTRLHFKRWVLLVCDYSQRGVALLEQNGECIIPFFSCAKNFDSSVNLYSAPYGRRRVRLDESSDVIGRDEDGIPLCTTSPWNGWNFVRSLDIHEWLLHLKRMDISDHFRKTAHAQLLPRPASIQDMNSVVTSLHTTPSARRSCVTAWDSSDALCSQH